VTLKVRTQVFPQGIELEVLLHPESRVDLLLLLVLGARALRRRLQHEARHMTLLPQKVLPPPAATRQKLRHPLDHEAVRRHRAAGVPFPVIQKHVGAHENVGIRREAVFECLPHIDQLFEMVFGLRHRIAVGLGIEDLVLERDCHDACHPFPWGSGSRP
jgi:hypothetical protein